MGLELPVKFVCRKRNIGNGIANGSKFRLQGLLESHFRVVDPFPRPLTPRSQFVTSLTPGLTMNGMFLKSSGSFTVASMNDIRVSSRNAGKINQVSARQWIEPALARAPARTVAGNYVGVLM